MAFWDCCDQAAASDICPQLGSRDECLSSWYWEGHSFHCISVVWGENVKPLSTRSVFPSQHNGRAGGVGRGKPGERKAGWTDPNRLEHLRGMRWGGRGVHNAVSSAAVPFLKGPEPWHRLQGGHLPEVSPSESSCSDCPPHNPPVVHPLPQP